MTELEKALNGENFNNSDEEVMAFQVEMKAKCLEYNTMRPDDPKRQKVLMSILGEGSQYVFIEPSFHCALGKNIHFKGLAMVNYNCTFLDMAPITIGGNALIGPGCTLTTTNHAIDPEERMRGLFDNKPIVIGESVWLGANVTVMPGVTIGDNAVIGAGSVVTKDIPANVIAVGVPCKVLREITAEDKLEK